MKTFMQKTGNTAGMPRNWAPRLLLAIAVSLVFALQGCSGGSEKAKIESPRTEQKAQPETRKDSGTDQPKPDETEKDSKDESNVSQAAAGGTMAEGMVEIKKNWTQIRSAPDANARAIGLAFGNDTFQVVEREGEWVRVRVGKNQEGWIPKEATE